MAIRDSMKKGTAELVVLHLLRNGRKYGYQIAQEIAARSNGLFTLQEGSLYPHPVPAGEERICRFQNGIFSKPAENSEVLFDHRSGEGVFSGDPGGISTDF